MKELSAQALSPLAKYTVLTKLAHDFLLSSQSLYYRCKPKSDCWNYQLVETWPRQSIVRFRVRKTSYTSRL